MSSRMFVWTQSVCNNAKQTMRILGMMMAIFLVSLPLFSQANQGAIQGGVFDQTGGAIVGATVTVIDVARGVTRALTTDSAGAYVAPNLTPGTYTVRAEAKGFRTVEHSGVLLEVGQTLRVDLEVQPGEQTQTITVTGEVPAIDTTDATLGGTIAQQALASLPLNGRDFKNVLELRPGVTAYVGGGESTFAADGVRPEEVGYLVDGVRADETYNGNSLINSTLRTGDNPQQLPLDAIQEMNTQENPKAELGWKPGAVINIGLKSGTNSLHGTAFAFGRTTAFDARNFFDTGSAFPGGPPLAKQPVALKQYGGSAGGPIIKDKLFWFVDYEGQQYTVGNIGPTSTPATVSLGGCTVGSPAGCGNPGASLVDACLNVIHTGKTIAPLSAQIAGLNPATCAVAPTNYTPGASESLFPTNTSANPVILALGNVSSQNNGIGKLDYHLNDKNSINGMYYIGDGGIIAAGTSAAGNGIGIAGTSNSPFNTNDNAKGQMGLGSWTWTPSSTKVNEFRVGYDRLTQVWGSTDQDALNINPLAYGINTGVTNPRLFGFPTVSITGFQAFGSGLVRDLTTNALQLVDHFSVVRGNHSLKFGGEFIRNNVNEFITSSGKGTIHFGNIQNFLQGNVDGANKIFAGTPARNMTNNQYAVFAQDDWRVTRKLIVNLGLRWEYNSVPTEAHNLLGNFDPTLGLVQVGNQIKSLYNGDFRNYSPRLGLAWDIRGNGKTVVRAGGSYMYAYPQFKLWLGGASQTLGPSTVSTGAHITTLQTGPAGVAGPGTIIATNATPSGAVLSPGWKAQTADCIAAAESLTTPTCPTIFPSSIFNITCGDGLVNTNGVKDPSPCPIGAVDRNLRSPYVVTWSMDIQQAITNNLTVDVGYLGTHAGRLPAYIDINQAAVGSGFTSAQLTCVYNPITAPTCGDPSAASTAAELVTRPFYKQFPYLSYIDQLVDAELSNYNSLQVTVTQRTSHGLNFLAGYTFSHALDDFSSTDFLRVPTDSTHPGLLYGSSDFDLRHRFTFEISYALPSKKSFGQLLQGWQLNSVVTLQSGSPWSPKDLSNDLLGTGETSNFSYYGETWNFSGNPADYTSPLNPVPCWAGSGGAALTGCTITGVNPPAACAAAASAISTSTVAALSSIGCYVSTNGKSVVFPAALGTNGDATRNLFRDSGFKGMDFSVTKDWKFKERLDAQFRVEFFNVLNHPAFANPGGIGTGAGFNDPSAGQTGNFGCGCQTPDQAAPNPVLGSGGPRSMQLGLKLIF